MGRFTLSRVAEQDLIDLLEYIAKDDPSAGLRFVEKLEEKCLFLADNPLIGKQRADLGVEVRTFPVANYLIIYRPAEDGIGVIRIVSGYRDIRSLFG